MIMGINGIKSGCDFPLWMQYMLVIYMISFIVLFGNFYAKAYIEKVRSRIGWLHTYFKLLTSAVHVAVTFMIMSSGK